MFKKIAVLCLMSLIGLLSGAVTICFAKDANNLEQAKQNVFSLLEAGDYAKADLATNRLIADFSGNPGLDEAVHRIAGEYQEVKNHQRAIELSRYVVTNWPKSEHAVWAQMAIVLSDIELGNETAAQTETAALKANFKDDPNLPQTLNTIGVFYMGWGNYGAAKEAFEEVIEKYPQSPQVRKSKVYLRGAEVLLLMDPNDYTTADAALNKLLDDFAGHPDLPVTAKIIGERYYKEGLAKETKGLKNQARDRFERAAKIWDGVIYGLPNPEIPAACCWAGDCYRKLGKYEESMRRFQKVVDDNPNYTYAWYAMFMVGRNYESMGDAGLISESEAQVKTRAAYKQLLRKHPNCRYAGYVNERLNKHNSK